MNLPLVLWYYMDAFSLLVKPFKWAFELYAIMIGIMGAPAEFYVRENLKWLPMYLAALIFGNRLKE